MLPASVAQPPSVTATGLDQAVPQYLTFTLNGETFAVGILRIREIIEYGTPTEIPMMPSFLRGVVNLRGAALPVIDLSARFGGQRTEIARRACIVVVEIGRPAETGMPSPNPPVASTAGTDAVPFQAVGLLVDGVNEVLDIPPADIEPPPLLGGRIRADFIQGMGKVAGKFVIVLNIERILSADELAQLAPTANGTPGA